MDNNVNNTPVKDNSKAFSITALVLGILSIVGGFIPYVSYCTLVFGIVGIVFGVKGRKTSPAGKTGMATAGLVCAIVGTALSVLGIICVLACYGAAKSAIETAEFLQ